MWNISPMSAYTLISFENFLTQLCRYIAESQFVNVEICDGFITIYHTEEYPQPDEDDRIAYTVCDRYILTDRPGAFPEDVQEYIDEEGEAPNVSDMIELGATHAVEVGGVIVYIADIRGVVTEVETGQVLEGASSHVALVKKYLETIRLRRFKSANS
jgi:hypothetical protein